MQTKIKNQSKGVTKTEEPEPLGQNKKKSIQQILVKLQRQGVNATLCKRRKFLLGS